MYPAGELDLVGTIVGEVRRDAPRRRPRHRPRRPHPRASRRTACTPTATRWRGGSSERDERPGGPAGDGSRGDRRHAGRPPAGAGIGCTCAADPFRLLEAGLDPRDGAHHRRRRPSENLPRILPRRVSARWCGGARGRFLRLFGYLVERGRSTADEAWRVFNMGVGFLLVVARATGGRGAATGWRRRAPTPGRSAGSRRGRRGFAGAEPRRPGAEYPAGGWPPAGTGRWETRVDSPGLRFPTLPGRKLVARVGD